MASLDFQKAYITNIQFFFLTFLGEWNLQISIKK